MSANKTKKRKSKKPRSKKARRRRGKKIEKQEVIVKSSDDAGAREAGKSNGHDEWTRERIVKLRNKLGLTQEQFAHKLGVTYVTVNRWENGRFSPMGLSLEALKRMEEEPGLRSSS